MTKIDNFLRPESLIIIIPAQRMRGYFYRGQMETQPRAYRVRPQAYRSEGFALTGYDIPGCVDDGAWMLQENSSVVVVAVVAHPDFSHGLSKYVIVSKDALSKKHQDFSPKAAAD